MSETFSVIFRGDILPGHTLPEVKSRMAQLFKLDEAKIAAVFSGKPVALKKDCDAPTAEKLKAVLTKAGAEVEIRSNTADAAPKPASPTPVSAPPSAPIPTSRPPATPPPQVAANPMEAGSLKVAPVGMVMTESERAAQRKPPVQVKTDHIALEKRANSFMTAEEKPVAKRLPIQAPDFGIATVGGDLLKPEEKRVFEELELDLSNYQVAELGADILPEDQKTPLPVMEIEELTADLAPVGSEMGQIKKAPPPPPPKTDHLKLV
jgi:hypothetical protein